MNKETENVHNTNTPILAKFINILDYLRIICWQGFCLIMRYSPHHGTKYVTINFTLLSIHAFLATRPVEEIQAAVASSYPPDACASHACF
jgi:hypothetical protein